MRRRAPASLCVCPTAPPPSTQAWPLQSSIHSSQRPAHSQVRMRRVHRSCRKRQQCQHCVLHHSGVRSSKGCLHSGIGAANLTGRWPAPFFCPILFCASKDGNKTQPMPPPRRRHPSTAGRTTMPSSSLCVVLLKLTAAFVLLATVSACSFHTAPAWNCLPCGGIYDCKGTGVCFANRGDIPSSSGCELPWGATQWLCCEAGRCDVKGTGVCTYRPAIAPSPSPAPSSTCNDCASCQASCYQRCGGDSGTRFQCSRVGGILTHSCSCPSGGLSSGATIGIIAGAIVLGILACSACCYWKHKRAGAVLHRQNVLAISQDASPVYPGHLAYPQPQAAATSAQMQMTPVFPGTDAQSNQQAMQTFPAPHLQHPQHTMPSTQAAPAAQPYLAPPIQAAAQ